MSRRLIDGMVVNVPDEDAPFVGVDIEDVMYEDQDAPAPQECLTPEEYEQAAQTYNSAQKLLLLLQDEGFVELLRLLKENADYHAESDRRYAGLDITKIQGLRMDRIAADYALEFVTNLLDSAKITPRPVLAQ